MFRWPKPWSKKRGDRRTGSPLLGNMGEVLLYSALFLFGTLSLIVVLVSSYLRSWPASQFYSEIYFVETQVTVRETHVEQEKGENVYRAELLVEWLEEDSVNPKRILLADGLSDREAGLRILDRYQTGDTYPAWYDPSKSVSLCMKQPGRYLFALTLVAVVAAMVIGGAHVAYTLMDFRTSPERRADLFGRVAKLDIVREATHGSEAFPAIPDVEDISNSPGVLLAYRLPIVQSPLLHILAAALFCLVWICVSAVFIQVVVSGLAHGNLEWILGLITLVFLGLGIWSLRYFWGQLLFAVGVGPTNVEISDHPLYPGGFYKIALAQAGRVHLDRLQLALVCEEEATFREGTEVRTESRQVNKCEIFTVSDVNLCAGQPFEQTADFEVPVEVMHSFRSANNSVQWKIIVEGIMSGMIFRRQFSVVLYPKPDNDRVGQRADRSTEV